MNTESYNIVSIDTGAADFLAGQDERGTPERNLLMAILERAILDYVGNDTKEARQAEEWIFGDEDTDDNEDLGAPFSFTWVCNQLDISKSFVSETIKAMPKRGARRVAPWYFTKKEGYFTKNENDYLKEAC